MRLSLLFSKSSLCVKTMVPGLAGLTLIMVKSGIQNFLSQPQQLKFNHESALSTKILQSELLWLSEALEGIIKVLFQSYNNYFTFLLMMLLVNVVLHGSSMARQVFRQEKKQSQTIFVQNSFEKRSQLFRTFLKRIIIYSAFYAFYQVILTLMIGSISLSDLVEERISPFKIQNSRILLEEEQLQLLSASGEIEWKKPSLSIGKTLSKLDITTNSIKLSKDGKTAFVSAKYPSALKIIDISDQEDPVILSSLSITKGSQDLILKSLIVFPDETKLFLSDIEYLEIIDISNLKSPKLIAKVQDSNAIRPSDDPQIRGVFKPNLLFSKDNRYLFIAGAGLQIFDISISKTPNLISSVRSQVNTDTLTPASIALSQDGKTLYYTDGSLWVYNVEDPREIRVLNSFNMTCPISSMMLSKDEKTAFVVGLNQESRVLLQKLKISDINLITEDESIEFDQSLGSHSKPVFLEQTPGDLFLFIQVMPRMYRLWHKLLIFDVGNRKLVTNENIFVKDAFSVIFTEDYRRVFVGADNKFEIAELYLDFPNKHAFTNSSNIIQTFETNITTEFREFQVASKNENIIYSMMRSQRLFGIHNLSNYQQQLIKIPIEGEIRQMTLSEDNQKAFLVTQNSIIIADISSPENINILGKYTGEEEDSQRIIRHFILSRDWQTGYITHTYFENQYLTPLSLSLRKIFLKKIFWSN